MAALAVEKEGDALAEVGIGHQNDKPKESSSDRRIPRAFDSSHSVRQQIRESGSRRSVTGLVLRWKRSVPRKR